MIYFPTNQIVRKFFFKGDELSLLPDEELPISERSAHIKKIIFFLKYAIAGFCVMANTQFRPTTLLT